MKRIQTSILFLVAMAMALPQYALAQKDQFNPIETGVVSLGIAPDARAAGMGDLGAATDPDAYSQFWNPSKYAFAYSDAAVSLSYTPWLRKIVNDIFLANVSGYWKFGGGDNQAVSASLRYFSLGEVSSYSEIGQTFNPYEMAFDIGYSRKLSESYSMGIVFRYIYSSLGYNSDGGSEAGDPVSGASAFSADISGYLTKYPIIGQNECQWSLGWNISNIGSKLNFDNGTSPAFLPTNLRIGTNFAFPLADYHTLSIGLDLNKLLVPTKPRRIDYADDEEGQIEWQQATIDWENTSSISGIFKSFSDAPGGMKEELQEITWSLGAEYNYNQQFFLRAGYYYENEYKGGRKYYGLGAGFALNVLRLDASYMIAASQNSPLDQTLRFSLTFDMDGIKEIFGRR
ncbi:type IX secretion system outer membrane channel protein PorV [Muribaculum intestinale]|uniref:type IX secretion system outer membrane channel protein PorV n=1 Tax=Muribaculum intestinale TaxID=1796646 RepID=UPI000F480919|nr:type IX secretion system outer membrane channel protein PorV [Muribaculum intestinale]ROT08578.1 hypothetical protein EEL42_05465 [Muribaculaceae bacterium Isolate-100 (HZI)]RXE66954.1 type IX secretion system outer membrane channel protein PorV [Muribaculaceae bacterium Isolate-007 (NCI)]